MQFLLLILTSMVRDDVKGWLVTEILKLELKLLR